MSFEKLGVECVLMCLAHSSAILETQNDVQLNM